MKIKSDMHDDIAIFTLKGELMGGADTNMVTEKVRKALKDGVKKIILDINRVTWINSHGMGALLELILAAKKSGAELVLTYSSKNISDVLNITKLDTILKTYDSIEEALDYLKS